MDIKFEGGHPIIYSQEIESSDKYKLLEIPDHYLEAFESLVDPSLPQTEKFSLIGLPNDETVLTTSTSTFVLKEAQTSNSLLLTQVFQQLDQSNLTYDKRLEVKHILDSYYEPTLVVGRLHRVKQLLLSTSFKGKRFEDELANVTFYSYESLREVVQASEQELDEMLDRLKVVTIEGKLRLIDNQYFFDAIDTILDIFVANELEPSNYQLSDLVTKFEEMELPKVILTYSLLKISKLIQEDTYAIDNNFLNKVLGEGLLFNQPGGKMLLTKFMDEWKAKCQHQDTITLQLLQGLYYLTEPDEFNQLSIQHLDKDDLPFNLKFRIVELFRRKKIWLKQELEPYLGQVIKPDTEANFLKESLKYLKMMVDGDTIQFRTKIPVEKLAK